MIFSKIIISNYNVEKFSFNNGSQQLRVTFFGICGEEALITQKNTSEWYESVFVLNEAANAEWVIKKKTELKHNRMF